MGSPLLAIPFAALLFMASPSSANAERLNIEGLEGVAGIADLAEIETFVKKEANRIGDVENSKGAQELVKSVSSEFSTAYNSDLFKVMECGRRWSEITESFSENFDKKSAKMEANEAITNEEAAAFNDHLAIGERIVELQEETNNSLKDKRSMTIWATLMSMILSDTLGIERPEPRILQVMKDYLRSKDQLFESYSEGMGASYVHLMESECEDPELTTAITQYQSNREEFLALVTSEMESINQFLEP
ncbi:hypothetical protein ACFOW6_15055 [Fodinicurvata halophila]|uniref:Uncharacterized protein n=1 Tax=Fodinicurvata halophila TaxID=1419723 RepID=A0ABV8UPA1_9PROT